MPTSKTFIKITNKDVYERIIALEKKVDKALIAAKINAAVIAVVISLVCAILTQLFNISKYI